MRVRVRYSGRVQGVGFRATARAIAERFPVTGWVRNEPDGDVLMEMQGQPAGVESALAEIRRTMQRHIRAEDVAPIGDAPGETGFVIER